MAQVLFDSIKHVHFKFQFFLYEEKKNILILKSTYTPLQSFQCLVINWTKYR